MSDDIPDYYRSLAESEYDGKVSGTMDAAPSENTSEEKRSKTKFYRADSFQMMLPRGGWRDKSVYTFTGPTVNGRPQSIIVTTAEEIEANAVADFAAKNIESVTPELDECRVLVNDSIELDCGHPAHRVILVWTSSTEDTRLYAEQLFVLSEGRGYVLTATFTRSSRKQIGEEVEHMMLSFRPVESDHQTSRDASLQ